MYGRGVAHTHWSSPWLALLGGPLTRGTSSLMRVIRLRSWITALRTQWRWVAPIHEWLDLLLGGDLEPIRSLIYAENSPLDIAEAHQLLTATTGQLLKDISQTLLAPKDVEASARCATRYGLVLCWAPSAANNPSCQASSTGPPHMTKSTYCGLRLSL